MALRSKELFQVGYFLSKFGESKPPSKLEVTSWNAAYQIFYEKLNGGRSVVVFHRSLKNTRDGFDSYFPKTNRAGWWKEKGVVPAPLPELAQVVFDDFTNLTEIEVWNIIEPHLDLGEIISATVLNDVIAEELVDKPSNQSETEGGVKVRVLKVPERNPKLRQKALDIHGLHCQVCGFDFEATYGTWGKGFAEVHHVIPLHSYKGDKTVTNPKNDLAVVCSNCHKMIHRKRNITLSLDELRAKLNK